MKVLHLEAGRHLYGGGRQVAYLLDGLTDSPVENLLVCDRSAGMPEIIGNPRVRFYCWSLRGDLDVGLAWRLRQLLCYEQPDILHIHSRRGELPAMLAGLAAKVPMIVTRRVDNREPAWQVRWKYSRFRQVIAISQGIAEVLHRQGLPPAKIRVVPSAVDTDVFRPRRDLPAIRKRLQIQPGELALAVVAQLIPRKGHSVLFEALARLPSLRPDLAWRCFVFGQGPLNIELQRLSSAMEVRDRIHFAGFQASMAGILPAMDLVVHPAWREGLGVALLESAACGLPIIASRAGGIPEVVRHGSTGLLVPPGDASYLAAAIARLATDRPLRAAMGKAGRRRIVEHYSIDSMTRGNYQVYQQVLSGL